MPTWQPEAYEDGHEVVFRLTTSQPGQKPQTKYYLSAYETRAWRDRVRAIGYTTVVGRVPAEAFEAVGDEELDALAAADQVRN